MSFKGLMNLGSRLWIFHHS